MENINNSAALKEAIRVLEIKKKEQEVAMKLEFHQSLEELNPLNSIKTTLKNFATDPDITGTILNAAIGLTTGFISKKIFVGGSHNPITKLAGTLIELGIAGAVTKNPEKIKTMGLALLKKLFSKKTPEVSEDDQAS